jgi:hypothetical protein
MNRRDFIVVTAVAGSVVVAPPALGQDEKQKKEPAPADVDAIMQLVRQKYADRLTDDQTAEIRQEVTANFRSAAALARFQLKNGDEPVLPPSDLYRLEGR